MATGTTPTRPNTPVSREKFESQMPLEQEKVSFSGRDVTSKFKGCANFVISRMPNKKLRTKGAVPKVWLEAKDPKHRKWKGLVGADGDSGALKKWIELGANKTHDLFTWMDSNPELEINLGDGTKSKISDIKCVEYFEVDEIYNFQVFIESGVWFYNDRSKIDTSKSVASPLKKGNIGNGYGVIVVHPNLDIFVHDYIPGKLHHISTTHGKPVFTAGLVKIANGILKSIAPMSGHYKCTRDEVIKLFSILTDNGIDIKSVNLIIPYLSPVEIQEILDDF